jgi:hypothetical protein
LRRSPNFLSPNMEAGSVVAVGATVLVHEKKRGVRAIASEEPFR